MDEWASCESERVRERERERGGCDCSGLMCRRCRTQCRVWAHVSIGFDVELVMSDDIK